MSTDGELYERDPEARNAYLAEGNAKQARKRVSADAIVRDSAGHILLVDPTYKPDWDLPGGVAEANEPPAASRRSVPGLREELGLGIQVGALLCVDWVSPHGPWDDLLNFIFDGGTSATAVLKRWGPAGHGIYRTGTPKLDSVGNLGVWADCGRAGGQSCGDI